VTGAHLKVGDRKHEWQIADPALQVRGGRFIITGTNPYGHPAKLTGEMDALLRGGEWELEPLAFAESLEGKERLWDPVEIFYRPGWYKWADGVRWWEGGTILYGGFLTVPGGETPSFPEHNPYRRIWSFVKEAGRYRRHPTPVHDPFTGVDGFDMRKHSYGPNILRFVARNEDDTPLRQDGKLVLEVWMSKERIVDEWFDETTGTWGHETILEAVPMLDPHTASLEQRVTLVDVGNPRRMGKRANGRGYLAEGGRWGQLWLPEPRSPRRSSPPSPYSIFSFSSGDFYRKYGVNLAWRAGHPIGPHRPVVQNDDFKDFASELSAALGLWWKGRAQFFSHEGEWYSILHAVRESILPDIDHGAIDIMDDLSIFYRSLLIVPAEWRRTDDGAIEPLLLH
jgi:hypothetical protein